MCVCIICTYLIPRAGAAPALRGADHVVAAVSARLRGAADRTAPGPNESLKLKLSSSVSFITHEVPPSGQPPAQKP